MILFRGQPLPARYSAARGRRGLTPTCPTPISAPPPAGWQSGYATDCKSVYSGSIPLPASNGLMPHPSFGAGSDPR